MNFTPIKFCLMPYAPQRLYLAVNRERALIPKTLYVFNCAIVNRHLVIDIWVHYWKVAVPSTGRRYVNCRTPWSYSYAGTGERRLWSLTSQLGEQSKDYFHEDDLIGPLNYSYCMFGPPCVALVMSISSYPVRRSRSFSGKFSLTSLQR